MPPYWKEFVRTCNISDLLDYITGNPDALKEPDDYGNRVLHVLAALPDNEPFARTCEKDPDALDVQNENGRTPLGCIIYSGSHANVEKLKIVSEIAPEKLEQMDTKGDTLLHMAARERQNDILEFLIRRVDINMPNGVDFTPVGIAMFHDNAKAVRVLLNNGADPSKLQGQNQRTLQYIGMFFNCPNSLVVLNEWNDMPKEKQAGIVEYHNKPTWRIQDHSEFPIHLRAQVLAVAVSLADMHVAKVLKHITKGIDAHTRHRALEF